MVVRLNSCVCFSLYTWLKLYRSLIFIVFLNFITTKGGNFICAQPRLELGHDLLEFSLLKNHTAKLDWLGALGVSRFQKCSVTGRMNRIQRLEICQDYVLLGLSSWIFFCKEHWRQKMSKLIYRAFA